MDKDKYKKRLHELVKQLKEQEPDLFAYLQQEVYDSMPKPLETEAFIRLQRKNMRQKGLMFYDGIQNKKLRNQLAADYANMLWYKCIGDIPHMFSFILFQTENMLNAFISNDTSCYDEIKAAPDKFVYVYSTEYSKKPFTIKIKEAFLTSDGNRQAIEKIGIWGKYAYWFIKTEKDQRFKEYTHSLVSDIINIRNLTEHRNSMQNASSYYTNRLAYWENNIDAKFSYVDLFLSAIYATIV